MQRKLYLLNKIALITVLLFLSSSVFVLTASAGGQSENLPLIPPSIDPVLAMQEFSIVGEIEGIGIATENNTITPQIHYPGTDEVVEEVLGDMTFNYSGGERLRGNIFQVDSTVHLVEHRMFMSIASPTSIYFVIYESTSAMGTYNLYHQVEITSGTGQIWYSSGDIDVILEAGYFYIIAVCWQGTASYYCGTTPPNPVSFGSQIHNVQPNSVYPPPQVFSGTIYSNTAYYQTIVTSDEIVTPDSLVVTLTPFNPPITIPANGGMFEFNIELGNLGSTAEMVDIWTMVTLPNGSEYGPLINFQDFNLQPGATPNRDREQNVPGNAPSGDYTYDAYLGSYPSTVYAEDHFDFSKLAVFDGGASITDWSNWGESFDESGLASGMPESFTLHAPYPNPFNPSTELTYSMQSAGEISLIVFDINGREVATLFEGYKAAGTHSAVWNAENFTSGVYFARLTAENGNTQTQKLVLMK